MAAQVISIVLLSLIIFDGVHARQSPPAQGECTPVAYPNEPRHPIADNVPPRINRQFMANLISVRLLHGSIFRSEVDRRKLIITHSMLSRLLALSFCDDLRLRLLSIYKIRKQPRH